MPNVSKLFRQAHKPLLIRTIMPSNRAASLIKNAMVCKYHKKLRELSETMHRLVSEFRESSCSLFGIESVLQRAGSKVQILAMRIGLS